MRTQPQPCAGTHAGEYAVPKSRSSSAFRRGDPDTHGGELDGSGGLWNGERLKGKGCCSVTQDGGVVVVGGSGQQQPPPLFISA